jgi:hypothetical protein
MGVQMKKVLRFLFFLCVLVPAFTAGGYAFQQSAMPGGQTKGTIETLIGTIDYMEQLGGYFLRGTNPGGEFFIVNQNPQILKTLKEGGKTVTVQGYNTSQGAEYFFITKIDGRKYKSPKSAK